MRRTFDRLTWVMLIGPSLLLGPGMLQGRALFWGTPLLQFIPWRAFALETLRSGFLPLWNPLVGMGAPLLANYQAALFYPPNWVLWAFDPAIGSTLLVALHLAWASIGMARLARRLGMSALGQAVAGMAFGLSGYLVARAGFFSINAAAAWLPWIVLAGDRLAAEAPTTPEARTRLAAVVRLAVLFALQWTAGHAQTSWYTLVLVLAWIAWRMLPGRGGRQTGTVLVGLAGAGALAFTLAAPQLLPTLEYLRESLRAQSLDPVFAMTYSFWPWRFLGLLAPGIFGSPVSGDYWGYGNFWEDAIYVGVLPLLLAIVAAIRGVAGRSQFAGLSRFLLVGMGLTALLALGDHTPVFPWLFRNVPTFDLFQAPARWMLLFVFGMALLAGAGATEWRLVESRGLYWSRLGTAGAVAMAVVAWLAARAMPAVEPTLFRSLSLAGMWLVLAGALVLLRRREAGRLWTSVTALVILADLLVAGAGLNPMTDAGLFRGRTETAGRLGLDGRVYMPADIEQRLKFEWAFRFDTFEALQDWRLVREAGLPNTLLLDAIPMVNNFDPLQPGRTLLWMQMLAGHPAPAALMRLMDVGWRSTPSPSSTPPVAFDPVTGGRRVRLVPQAVSASGGIQALALVAHADFDPEAEVVIEGDGRPLPEGGGAGRAWLVPSADPNRLEVRVEASGPTWLVVSDSWYPGWVAEVDGQPAALWRADYLFRAVHVPGGGHVITFAYRPASLRWGAGLAVLGTLLALVTWTVAVHASRARKEPIPTQGRPGVH